MSLSITVNGDRAVIEGLHDLSADLPQIIGRGLERIAKGTHRKAFDWLSGAGGLHTYETRTSKSGKSYQKRTGSKIEEYEGFSRRDGSSETFRRYKDSGGYPVPVRTGHLRRSLDWVRPGATKSRDGKTFSAGEMEVIVYDSAIYASAIHEGRGSSKKFGRRPFIEDAFKSFNASGRAVKVLEEEIEKAAAARGFRG